MDMSYLAKKRGKKAIFFLFILALYLSSFVCLFLSILYLSFFSRGRRFDSGKNSKTPRTQIYMDLSYIYPQARVLIYCYK